MFLSRLLCSARWTPGRQSAGKHRRKVKVTPTMRKTVLQRKERAEEVLQQLATPYLTRDEDRGHTKARKFEDYKEWCERVRKRWGLRKTMATKEAFTEIRSLQHDENRSIK